MVIVVLSAIAGASVLAATHPQGEYRFTAEAAITFVQTGTSALPTASVLEAARQRVGILNQLLELDPVIERIRRETLIDGPVDELRDRVSTDLLARQGVIRVHVRDRTPERATALANAVVHQAGALASQVETATGRIDLAIGDFEQGLGSWGGRSEFSAPPQEMMPATGGARFGDRWLRVTCDSIPGCGPGERIEYPFRAATAYRLSAWMKSSVGSRVRIVFGTADDHVATNRPLRLTSTWTRAVVTWSPRRDTSAAEVAFLGSERRSSFGVDGVLIADPSNSRSGSASVTTPDEIRAMRLSRYAAVIVSAEPTGSVRSSTAGWALKGAAAGALIAFASLGAGRLAERRASARVPV